MSRTTQILLLWFLLLVPFLSGCIFDSSALDAVICDSDDPCESGFVCVSGICEPEAIDITDVTDVADTDTEDMAPACDAENCDGDCCDVEGASVCIDTRTSAEHCGGCGLTCPPGETCDGALCSGGCPPLAGDCDGRDSNGCEVNLLIDNDHCGACNNPCESPTTCDNAVCLCGETQCDGDQICCDLGGATCVDYQTDVTNCGGCGIQCGDGEMCVDGQCACGENVATGPACGAGTTCCLGTCADLQTSNSHCGACQQPCFAEQACNGGVCECNDSLLTTCGADCTDLTAAPHCGGCNIACAANQECCNGVCATVGTSPTCPGTSCKQLRDDGATSNGAYWIQTPSAPVPFRVQCDMGTDGGGWTLVMRSVWDWSSTQSLYTGYAAWKDTTIGLPNDGLAYRLAGTYLPELQTTNEHLITLLPRATDATNCTPLKYIATDGVWDVQPTTAFMTGYQQPINLFLGSELSTTDSGPNLVNCVANLQAVPWLYNSCCNLCPSFKGSYWLDEPHPQILVSQASIADSTGATLATACGILGPQLGNRPEFAGLNSLEYYVR